METEKKPLEQLLIEHGVKQTAGQPAKNYATFMERWDEICAAYNKGWSYRAIWTALHDAGAFPFSYPAFTSYIRKVKNRQERGTAEKNLPVQKQPQQQSPKIGRAELPVYADVPQRESRRF
jgi:hypothetical protein